MSYCHLAHHNGLSFLLKPYGLRNINGPLWGPNLLNPNFTQLLDNSFNAIMKYQRTMQYISVYKTMCCSHRYNLIHKLPFSKIVKYLWMLNWPMKYPFVDLPLLLEGNLGTVFHSLWFPRWDNSSRIELYLPKWMLVI